MELLLTREEHELLSRLLQEKHRELLQEISHTDTHDFKLLLRRRAGVLEAILGKLDITTSDVA